MAVAGKLYVVQVGVISVVGGAMSLGEGMQDKCWFPRW